MVRRRVADIVLLREELFQSLREQGDLIGESTEVNGADSGGTTATLSAKANTLRDIVDDDVKKGRVIEVITLAVEEAGDMLYPYTKSTDRMPTLCLSDDYYEPNVWRINLSVPIAMSNTTICYIKDLIKEYVVGRVFEEFFRIYMTDRLLNQHEKLEDTRARIRAAKDRRNSPVRRTGSIY